MKKRRSAKKPRRVSVAVYTERKLAALRWRLHQAVAQLNAIEQYMRHTPEDCARGSHIVTSCALRDGTCEDSCEVCDWTFVGRD